MTIHSRSRSLDGSEDGCKYTHTSPLPSIYPFFTSDFYNYFQFGVDFFISSSTHLVQKILLHTNIVREAISFAYLNLMAFVSPEPQCSSVTNGVLGKLRVYQKMRKTVLSLCPTVLSYLLMVVQMHLPE